MKNKPTAADTHAPGTPAFRLTAVLCALLAASFAPMAGAGVTDLSNQPLATLPTVKAKPNLLFVMDTSGSMNWSYMPDDLGASQSVTDQPYTNWYGYWSPQCNGVAYDPTSVYNPPLKADGTPYPNASFTAAWTDGYTGGTSTTNLGNSYYYSYSGTQPKMGWTYTSNGAVNNTFYQECSSAIGSTPGSSVFTKVTMTSSSADAQNYANWYSYYRKRYLLMRTAMGRAINALDSNYRVGFSTIYDTAAQDGKNNFVDVTDFDATQKVKFYNSLYGVAPSGNTPLPTALSKAGRYFAHMITGQTSDPMQYACQRNYTLMSTDGYWNVNNSVQLDGQSAIGQQDGTEARPMRDNTQSIVTSVVTYTSAPQGATRTQSSNTQSRTSVWSRTATTVSSTPVANGKNKGLYQVTTVPQTYTETQTQAFTTPQAATASYTVTTVTTDGVVTSGPTTSAVSYSTWVNTAAATVTTTDTNPPTGSTVYTSGSTTTSYQTAKGTGVTTYTTPTQGGWSSWSPSLSYTYSTPVVGAYTASAPVATQSTSGGSPNTLADVAEYYYKTDLRSSSLGNCTSSSSGSSQDVCADIVRPVDTDSATWQHMNTFTIGLGASGTLPYDRNYLTQTSGTYVSLTNGTLNWPTPNPSGDATNIDDLWHAAVNGRGQYYSALNATLLSEAINGVVTTVQKTNGSAAAASTSSLQLVAGTNNQVYQASYTTGSWTGDLLAFALNGADASVASTPTWSAQALLDTTSVGSRKIYFNSSGTLQTFSYGNLSTAQKAYFDNLCSQSVVASQCAGLSTSDKTLANNGSNLVSYLSGVRTYESASGSVAALYRQREHVLGDIINGAPVYVGKPPFSYADAGYATFLSNQSSRKPVVYVAANDGMLHAFSADTSDGGKELWAFIPSAVMPNLYKLADASYASKHQYFVDGAPVMADIQVGSTWKTILVGGLNEGGQGYYALDITDPANPKVLWEFTDTNLGLSYGNPVVTKRADGTWVVAFASGYNNTSGDGMGHLYVVNANTGAKLLDISTGTGSSASPSGLAKINVWVDDPSNNTAKRFYGGDLQGNLWRFDTDNLVQPNKAALQLAKFQINSTTPQPITTKPETVQVKGVPVIVVATGRYLGVSDISDKTQESIYAVKDPLTSTGWGDVRASSSFVQQTFTVSGTNVSVTTKTVDWTAKGGWWVDFPNSGERVATNLGLQFNTLAIVTAIPNGDACASGGSSWRYYLNVANGGPVTNNPAGMLWSSNSLVVGMSWVKDSNGNVRILYQNSNGGLTPEIPPTVPSSGSGSAHRTSWRELAN